MRKRSSNKSLIMDGPPKSYQKARAESKNAGQGGGAFGNARERLSGPATEGHSFATDAVYTALGNEQQARGYRAVRETSRGSRGGHQMSTEREQHRMDSTLASSKRSLKLDPTHDASRGLSEQEQVEKVPSHRGSKKSSRTSKSKKGLRSLSFQTLESLTKAGAAPENNAIQDSEIIDQIIQEALEMSGQRTQGSKKGLSEHLSKLSMLNLLGAYDQVVKCAGQKGRQPIESLQATRIYRQLLKMHRERQEVGGGAEHEQSSRPEARVEKRGGSTDSVDILPEKQRAEVDLLSESSQELTKKLARQLSHREVGKKPEDELEEQFARLMARKKKQKVPQPTNQVPGGRPPKANEATQGPKPALPKLKFQDLSRQIAEKDQLLAQGASSHPPVLPARNATKDLMAPVLVEDEGEALEPSVINDAASRTSSKAQMMDRGPGEDRLDIKADQQAVQWSARFSQRVLNARDGGTLANAGQANGTHSFPDFHLKPDISHFAQDKFNLRVTMHDESSLFMNDSVEDGKGPDSQMAKEVRPRPSRDDDKNREANRDKQSHAQDELDKRVMDAKQAFSESLEEASRTRQGQLADADDSRIWQSSQNSMASNSQPSAYGGLPRSQNLQSLRYKRPTTQMKQEILGIGEQEPVVGKDAVPSRRSSGQRSNCAPLRPSRSQLGHSSSINADLDHEAPRSEVDAKDQQHYSVPKPISLLPPAPTAPPEQPMLITLGQPPDSGGEQATEVQSLMNLVQGAGHKTKRTESKRSSKKDPERRPSFNSQKSKREQTSHRALSSRLQFKRNLSSCNRQSSDPRGAEPLVPRSRRQTELGEVRDEVDNRRLLSGRQDGLTKHEPTQQSTASMHCLNLVTLQKDLSELDQQINKEYKELNSFTQMDRTDGAALRNHVPPRPPASQQMQKERQMIEVLHLQNEKLLELAISHWKFITWSKVMGALASNTRDGRRERQLDDMSLIYRKTRLLTTSFNKLKYFIKIVAPEERTMAVAFRQYQIALKEKVWRELNKHANKKMLQRIKLEEARRRLVHAKKYRLFNHFMSYAASTAIKKAQNRQAVDKRRCYLLRDAFTSLHLHTVRSFNLNLMFRKAALYHANSLLKKTFNIFVQNMSNVQYERRLDSLCKDFVSQRSSQYDLKLSVFIALHKYAAKQKQEREATVLYRASLLRKAFDQLQSGLQIQRNYQHQKTISTELYNQRLLQMAFSTLVQNVKEELLDARRAQEMINKSKMRRHLQGMHRVAARISVSSHLENKAAIRCARELLRHSFGQLMEQVWREYPSQKISHCREVQGGRVELPLPNYLAVSKSHKYCEHFIKVNEILLRDLQARAMRALRINRLRMRQFQQNRLRRHQRFCFYALYKGVQGEVLIEKYIDRAAKLRNMRLLKEVLRAMKTTTRQQAGLDDKFCLVLKARKDRIVYSSMRTWIKNYREARQSREHSARADEFLRSRQINKHLTIWIRRLAQKMKKKHLVANVLPLAKNRIVARSYFAAWRGLYKKNLYLSQQLHSIERFQNNEVLRKFFSILKEYTHHRQQKHHKSALARQQYIYFLGKRVFSHLLLNTHQNLNKQLLNTNIKLDHQLREKQKILTVLRNYAKYRHDRRLNDHLMSLQVARRHEVVLFQRWQRLCRKRQCLRYIESILDEARQRKCFRALGGFALGLDARAEVVVRNKYETHIKVQYFRELARLAQRRKELAHKGLFLAANCEPQLQKRMMRQWKRRFRQRQAEYKMFSWTVLQIKRGILQNYFKELRRNAIMKRLKRTSPLIYVENMLRKTFKKLHLHSLTEQRHLTIYTFIKKSRDRRLQHFALEKWRFRHEQAQTLRERAHAHLGFQKKKLFRALQLYGQRRRAQRKTMQLQGEALRRSKKRCALQKLKLYAGEKQLRREKMLVAADFNNQFMYQQAFAAWFKSYRENRGLMQSFRQAREVHAWYLRRTFLGKWIEAAERPITKLRAVQLMHKIFQRREVINALTKFWQQVEESREKEKMADHFLLMSSERRVSRTFQAMCRYVQLRMDQRQRLLHVDLYCHERLKSMAIQSLKWYLQERRDKQDMQEIAGAQRTSTLLRSVFFALKNHFQKRRALSHATMAYQEQRTRRSRVTAIQRLRMNVRTHRQAKMFRQKADIFRSFKAYEKVFRGIFSYCVRRAASNISKQKAHEFREETLLRQHFFMIKNHTVSRKILFQKREMLFQVVQTIDQHNLLQNSYDSLFRHLVSSTNDVSNAQQQLRLQKMERLFRVLLWNASKQKALRQVSQQVQARNLAIKRANSFLQWRTHFMQVQVLAAHFQSRRQRQMQRVLAVLARRCELKLKLTRYLALSRQNLLQSCFEALGQKIVLKQIKEAQVGVANSNFRRRVQAKVMQILKQHTARESKVTQMHYQRDRARVKQGLRAWFEAALKRQQQRGLLAHLVGKRDHADKLLAFKTMQRCSFLSKMCHILRNSNKMTKSEERQHRHEVQAAAFAGLRTHSQQRKRLRLLQGKIQGHRERKTLAAIMMCLKQYSRSHLLCLKLQRAIDPKLKELFDTLKRYAEKEARLLEIEKEVKDERQFQTKNRILYSWALLLDKRENIAKFIANRQSKCINYSFEALKQYCIDKQIQKDKQKEILHHFSKKRPQCLHMFSKAFLLLNFKAVGEKHSLDVEMAKLEGSKGEIAAQFSLSSALMAPSHPIMHNSDQSAIEEMHSAQQAHSYASDLGVYYQGVRLCPTVLAKYVFEKWKLTLGAIKQRNRCEQLAQEQFAFTALNKTFQAWRSRSSIKAKERRLLEHGREFRDEVLQKKAYEILVDYMHKRNNIRQLKAIGDELRGIRQAQQLHKMLVSWYDATVEAVNSERRFDGIIQTFQQMQQEKLLPLTFNSWKDLVQQKVEKRKMKQDLNEYAIQIYLKNLQRRALAAMREQLHEEITAAKVSKLFPIFQAWKFHVKENSLLKKYLSQAEQRSQRNHSILSEDEKEPEGTDYGLSDRDLDASSNQGPNSMRKDLVHSLFEQGLPTQTAAQMLDSKLSITDINDSVVDPKNGPQHALEQHQQLDSGYHAENSALKLSFMKKK